MTRAGLLLLGLQLAALVASLVALVAACEAERQVSALPDGCLLHPVFCAEIGSYDLYGRPRLDVTNVPFGRAKGPALCIRSVQLDLCPTAHHHRHPATTTNVWSGADVHTSCTRANGPLAGKPCCEATKTGYRYCTPTERAWLDARPFWPKDGP